MPSCSFCNDTRSNSGCPMCDPSAPVPAIPGRKSKAARKPAARVAARPATPATPTPPVSRPAPVPAARPAVLTALPAPLAYTVKPAKFASKCPDCRQPILPGQMIRVPKTQGNGYSRHDVCAAPAVPDTIAKGLAIVEREMAKAEAAFPEAFKPAPTPPAVVQTFPKVAAPAWASKDWRGALTAPKSAAPQRGPGDDDETQVDPLKQPIKPNDWRGLWEREAAGLLTHAEAVQIAATWKGGASA